MTSKPKYPRKRKAIMGTFLDNGTKLVSMTRNITSVSTRVERKADLSPTPGGIKIKVTPRNVIITTGAITATIMT